MESNRGVLCFPLALIDCLQQEKHRLSPLTGELLSDVIITPLLSLKSLSSTATVKDYSFWYCRDCVMKLRFTDRVSVLHACPRARSLFKWRDLTLCISEAVVCGPFYACPFFLGEIKEKRQAGEARENHFSLPLIFVYRQQTTRKVLLSQFSVARRWAPGRTRQRNGGMMKSRAVQGRCFLGLLGAEEYTCPLLTHCDGSMKQ